MVIHSSFSLLLKFILFSLTIDFYLFCSIYFIFVISTCGAIFEFSEPLSKLMPWNMYFVFDWPTPMELYDFFPLHLLLFGTYFFSFAIVINTLLAFDFLMIPPKSSYTFSAISWLINLNSPFIWYQLFFLL